MVIPSIFNDVIGPVMRGPSSSHSAAAVRIGRIARELMGGELTEVIVKFDLDGSLPTTYLSQGSDMGLSGGLLGFDAADERLIDYRQELQRANLSLCYVTDRYGDPHPNTYNLVLKNTAEEHRLVAISTGGGMIEVISIDNLPVSYCGDCFALAIWTEETSHALLALLEDSGCTLTCPDPGTPRFIFAKRSTRLDQERKARGLLAGGLVGVLIAARSTFSAEICGCQAECGVSSGMIAAAMVTMMGGNASVALGAAAMALQNSFGMVCDPVAGRVEVPCLGKNIMAASNGLSSANLALAGFDQVIPFDETVAAMDSVGRSLPHELRCTALGGLSLTATSTLIARELSTRAVGEA